MQAFDSLLGTVEGGSFPPGPLWTYTCWGHYRECAIRPVATCVSCGDRRLVEDLVEAVEGDNLTHDAGTRFCRPCVLSSGVSF